MPGGGGTGGNASVTVEAISPGAAAQFGENAANAWSAVYETEVDRKYAVEDRRVQWQEVLAGLIGTYSIVQQYNLNRRMVELAERAQDSADELKDLSIQNYNEIIKAAFDKACDYWNRYLNTLSQYEPRYMQDAFANTDYDPEYATQKGRAMAGVQRSFDVAIKAAHRARSPYAVGACCDATTRLNIARANAMVALSNASYRYEDQKKITLEEQYFQRKTAGMRVLASIAGLAGNMMTGAAGLSSAGINAVSNAVSQGNDAYGQMANAVAGMGDFWGTIGSGAFRYMGYNSFNRAPFGEIRQPYQGGSSSVVQMQGGMRSEGVFSRGATPSMGDKLNPAGYAVSEPTVSPYGVGTYSVNTGQITY